MCNYRLSETYTMKAQKPYHKYNNKHVNENSETAHNDTQRINISTIYRT